ncbi:hypothetical protein DL764_006963 [Monosporascus ibericus]|uniref:Uncharacterized protein n=1 Tax=Monosporascus ibericus TaxID=155417 RepID=A0A4Q4T5N8_9PEZI|nr:hypothetical protein DL764_006963 [Monosporascus ibericus]
MPACLSDWREASPGLWYCAVDEMEQFYTALTKPYEGSGRHFFAITGHISLEVGTAESHSREDVERRIEDAVRKGRAALRYDHLTIASRVMQDPGTGKFSKIYRTSKTDAQRDPWPENTVKVVSTGQTGMEWANSDHPVPDLPASLYYKTASVQHWSFAEDDPYQLPDIDGSEPLNLSPPFRIAANVPPTLTEAQQRRRSGNAVQNAAAAEGDEAPSSTSAEDQAISLDFKHGPHQSHYKAHA